MTEASTSMLIPTIPHCASDDQEATPFNGNMDRHHCQDGVWLTVRCLNWQCIYKWYIIQCCRGVLKNICANSGCKARLFKNSLGALKDFCLIILGAKQDFCSNILGAKQEICSNILGAKQHLCSNILGAKQHFCSSTNILGAKQDLCSNILGAKQDFCSNILGAKQHFCSNILGAKKGFCFWVPSKTFFNHYGCKARLLFKHLWCK